MGIKGIYKEIGPGKRISLCKLAVDHFKQTECKRPFRLAVDFAIWAHQLQAAQGGASPAMRTLFYRLVRLVTLNIDPIFVFDGPRKPAFKRNKRSRREGDTLSKAMAQQIIRLFGFATHNAPGEAEAECALLQREGIVDAVLSEDVDTIMFGCTRTLRNWSAEGRNRAQTPTHVSLYDAAEMRQDETGLDREGLVLVALMSGGDYAPEGVPGCGVKLACEAAKAGFGTRLCRIKRSETAALQTWRDDLIRELKTNESKFFRVKHKALTIPEEFPDFEILRHYTHPVVSDAATIARMKAEFPPERAINVVGLRAFTAETFDWSYRPGALKLIRVLAPALLIRALVDCSGHNTCSKAEEKSEASLIQCVVQSRMHFSTDATPELRVKYIPNAAVGLKLDEEEDVDADATSTYGRAGLALNSDDGEIDEADAQDEKEPPKKIYDPHEADLCWVPEAIVKHGAPLIVESWDREQKDKTNRSTKGKNVGDKTETNGKTKALFGMPAGSMDKYVRVLKIPSTIPSNLAEGPSSPCLPAIQPPRAQSKQFTKTPKGKPRASAQPLPPSVNPWSIANSQITPKPSRATERQRETHSNKAILVSSSPPATAGTNSPAAASQSPNATPRPRFYVPPLLDLDNDDNDDDDMLAMNNYLQKREAQASLSSNSAISLAKRSQRQQTKPDARSVVAAIHVTKSGTTNTKRTKKSSAAKAARPAARFSIKNFGRLTKVINTSTINLSTTSPAGKSSSFVEISSDDDDGFVNQEHDQSE